MQSPVKSVGRASDFYLILMGSIVAKCFEQIESVLLE